jgi:hypothetical protein
MRVISQIAALAALLIAGAAHAQGPSFTARLGRNPVGIGDAFSFEVALSTDNGRVDDYRRPEFRGFRVLAEQPSQSTQIQMGGPGSFMRQSYTWHYQLVALQKGKLTIGPASVRVDGRVLSTDKVAVTVVDPGQAPAPRRPRMPRGIPGFPGSSFFFPDLEPEEEEEPEPTPPPPPAAAGQAVPAGRRNFLQVVASKTKAFVGEQITVEWSLYLSGQQSNYAPSKEPRTDGFWVEELEVPNQGGRLSLSQQVIDGRVYLVGPLMRKALFALRPGRYTVTPLEADVSRANFFGATVQSEHLKADPLTLEIVPLPPGAPAGLDASAVGHFKLSAAVDRDHVQTGDAITLRLRLEGDGNLNKIPVPTLPPLPGWKIYDPKITVQLRRRDNVGGSKTAEYLLLPEQPGQTTIPPLAFAYFDPQRAAYATERTAPIVLTVTGEARPQSPAAKASTAASPRSDGENVLALEVRPIRNRPNLRRDLGAVLYRSPVMLGIVLAPPGLLALVSLVGFARARMSRESESQLRRKLRRSANRRLRTAAGYLQAGKLASSLAEIERVLREFLTGKIGRTVAGMSRDELRATLEALGAAKVLVDGTVAALDTCDRARFAPGSLTPEEASNAIDQAGEIIEDFEKLTPGTGGAA